MQIAIFIVPDIQPELLVLTFQDVSLDDGPFCHGAGQRLWYAAQRQESAQIGDFYRRGGATIEGIAAIRFGIGID